MKTSSGGGTLPGIKTSRVKRGAVYALAPSHKNINTLWAGTDDGFVWVTRDGGKNWTNVTPPEVGAWNKVTQIDAGHFDDNTAYVSVSRLRIDDLHPLIFRTHDGGKTWQQIIAGIPDNEPADTVREDPVRRGLLYAGTEKAVYVSFDDGDHWQPLQLNLPHTSMRDLWIKDSDLIVATHGRGFWILDDMTLLQQVSAQMAQQPVNFRSSPLPRGASCAAPGRTRRFLPMSRWRRTRPTEPPSITTWAVPQRVR